MEGRGLHGGQRIRLRADDYMEGSRCGTVESPR